jgi:uncharacterized protein
LPDQNYLHGSDAYPAPRSGARYGRVLVDAYRMWREIDDPGFRVRKFSILLAALFGETPGLDSLGTGPIRVFTIETNGAIEPVDTFKICGDGFTKTGRSVFDLPPLEVNTLPWIKLGLNKRASLPVKCQSCRHQALCGGGYLPHRYSQDGFDRETVYCEDMVRLCDTIVRDVAVQVAQVRQLALGTTGQEGPRS